VIESYLFFILCACLSTVHVLVTLKQRQGRSIPMEVFKHFIYLTGLILILGGLIQGISVAYQ